MRCQRAWLLMIAMALGFMAVSSCSTETRYHVLSKIFEEVPAPGEKVQHKPVVHGPRRSPLTKLAPAPEEIPITTLLPNLVTPQNWRQLLRKLPKEAAGGVDWDDALAQKLIQPRSGLDPDTPDQPAFDLNLELIPEGQPFFKVIFPHKEHTEWLACANCHTDIFKMQRGGDPITMTKIYSGEYCGRCHGKVSFALPTGCPRCHAALAGPAKTK